MQGNRGRFRRPRLTILVKLVAAFVLPTIVLFSLFGFFAHEVQRRDLEAELGHRLEVIATAASTQLRGKYLETLDPVEEEKLLFAGALRRLEHLAVVTGVARIYVFDRDYLIRVDTGGEPLGAKQFQAEIDRKEVQEVFATGKAASSLLFEGLDQRLYKAGYAPVFRSDEEREIVLAIGVDAPADFFEHLASLRRQLILYGLFFGVAVAMVAVLVAVRITRPVRHLAEAAERIGAGDLAQPVERVSGDEIGFLAETMEQMRSDLRTRDERMQLMLAGIAHEVRNPLGGIELFAGILRDELTDDAEKSRHVERIERELGYLKTVVESFLEYARRPDPEFVEVDLHAVVSEVVELEQRSAAQADVELGVTGEPTRVRADSAQLRRAVHNLVRNAIQAAQKADHGKVVVEVKSASGVGTLMVYNNGEHMDVEVQKRLFEPFYSTKEKGTGLGLAFVKEIIQDHGGTIEFESGAESGTLFRVQFPTR